MNFWFSVCPAKKEFYLNTLSNFFTRINQQKSHFYVWKKKFLLFVMHCQRFVSSNLGCIYMQTYRVAQKDLPISSGQISTNLMSKVFEFFSIEPLCIYHCSAELSFIYFKYSASYSYQSETWPDYSPQDWWRHLKRKCETTQSVSENSLQC